MGGCPTGTAPGSFPRGGRKRGLQTDLQNEIVQEIEDLLARQSIADLDLEALEMAARCQALRLAARALEQRLNTDTSDYVGPELPCPCGGVARYHGRHGKTFESVLGPLHLKRAYYDCGRCHQGFCPRDRALKLESFSLTPGVLRMTASAAALVSFEESSGLLHELAGVEVSVKQVERAAEALRQVALGDGATWIWNTATELFPQATQILDRFHAKEHLGEVGKVIYGDRPEGQAWIDARCEELDKGHLKSLVHALRSHIGQHKEARECIQYIWRNRRRMRYPQFEKQGFCTSTGVVESGCKIVVGTRLKRAGMHWTVKGANAIIALRCSKLSGRFQDFWERRSERKQVAA